MKCSSGCRSHSGHGRGDYWDHHFCRFRSGLILFRNCCHKAAGVSRPSDLANGEHEAFGHGGGSREDDHLVRLESCMHSPYLARHCRQKLVGNLPWGIPMVVDYRHTGAQATNSMVTQDTDKDFIHVRPP